MFSLKKIKKASQQSIVGVLFLLMFTACFKPGGTDIQTLDKNWRIFSDTLDTLNNIKLPGSLFHYFSEEKKITQYHSLGAESLLAPLSEKTWIWETEFLPDETVINHKNLILKLEGVNTYAKVSLNNKDILLANNMFRTFEIPVKDLLQNGFNKLSITFFPQSVIIDSLAKKGGAPLPDNRAYLRKAAYQSGWDWAPKIVSPEIISLPELIGWSKIRVRELSVLQPDVNNKTANLSLVAEIEADQKRSYKLNLLHQGRKIIDENIQLEPGMNNLAFGFEINNPVLWWPKGYGKQHLYKFEVQVLDGNKVIFHRDKQVGLRKIAIAQKTDSIGQSFTFVVNGTPIYARGANFVPEDLFTSLSDQTKTKELLVAAAESGMNMLRVWGGGVYPSDAFYNICDSLGILIWQDFMFANTLYPFDSEFLKNVESEATQQIKRLRGRTALALWCGNNEIDEGFHNWGWEEQLGWSVSTQDSLWEGYQILFESLLPTLVKEFDPNTFYWPSSPATGWGRDKSLKSGDVHYWGVWWGEEPFEMYRKKVGRFNSEFGFQSMPAAPTLKKSIPKEQWFVGSEAIEYYQKHPRGTILIDKYMKKYFPVPEKLDDYIYMSQLTQSFGIGMAVEAQRLSNAHSSGTLIWQLNDAWPGISWSMIDFDGRPKALYYHLKRFYQPVLIGINSAKTIPEALLVNHGKEKVKGRMTADLIDFKGNVLYAFSLPVELGNGQQQVIPDIMPADIFNKIDKRKVWLKIRLTEEDKTIAAYNHFFVSPKHIKLPKAEIYVRMMPRRDFVEIILQSDVYVKSLELFSNDLEGTWENNFFDFEPDKTITVRFYPSGNVAISELKFEKRFLNQFLN